VKVPPPVLLVSRRLATLRERMVFVGGSIRGLLVTDPAAQAERPTDDVDVIVEVASLREYHQLGDDLRSLGFREDTTPGAPICRWIVEDVRVDVMPTHEEALRFNNHWYREAAAHAVNLEVDGHRLRVIDAPHFCATKLEAFSDRGDGDFYHRDLKDVVAVVDGRMELRAELIASGTDIRRFVAHAFQELLAAAAFRDTLAGHLPGDAVSQGRLPLLLQRLHLLAALGGR
jgi:predicted nucleotidyltransferase